LRRLKRGDRCLRERTEFSIDRPRLEAPRGQRNLQRAHVGTFRALREHIRGAGFALQTEPGRRARAAVEQMRRRVAWIDREDVGKRSVGRKRRRFSRPPIRQHLALGKRTGRDGVSLIAAEKNDVVAIVAIVERNVSGRTFRIAAPEHDDAAAARLLFQILAKLLVAAGEQAFRAAIAGKRQARSHEGGAPRCLVVFDLGVARETIHFQDFGIVHRAVHLGGALEMGCNRKPGRSHAAPRAVAAVIRHT
jgi:hypothetical protein